MPFDQQRSIDNPIYKPLSEEELDLNQVFNSFKRNRILIATFGFAGLIIGAYIALSTKRTWQGEFELVLKDTDSGSILKGGDSFGILALAGLKPNIQSNFKTQVQVLQSPLLLGNVFEFVKKQSELTNGKIDSLRFNQWSKKVSVLSMKNSSVLTINYKDQNKDIILPVLKKIVANYQEYSLRNRIRRFELGESYLNEQIKIYKEKSKNSFEISEEYAIEHDLNDKYSSKGFSNPLSFVPMINVGSAQNVSGGSGGSGGSGPIGPSNIDMNRVEAKDRVNFIDNKIKEIDKLKFDSDQIRYIAGQDKSFSKYIVELNQIDTTLSRLRTIYRDNDRNIKELIDRKYSLINSLKEQVKGSLLADKASQEMYLRVTYRPKEVLIKYKQLKLNSLKDKETLVALENQYRALSLERAQNQDPWTIITKPTLFPNPYSPRRKRILAIGLMVGVFMGATAGLINDRRKDGVFSMSEMESFDNWPLLAELPINEKKIWEESLDLLVSSKLSNMVENIAFLVVGQIDQSLLTELNNDLKRLLKTSSILITNNFIEVAKSSNLILITALGITTFQELFDTRKKLLFNNIPVVGLITLKNI